ncbi:MAG: hypothetical protein ABJM81_28390 [Rhodopirellula bahusiensis]
MLRTVVTVERSYEQLVDSYGAVLESCEWIHNPGTLLFGRRLGFER